MVEVLDSTKEVFAIAKRNSFNSIVVTTDGLPNFSQLELLTLFGDWAYKSKLKEDLRHLWAADTGSVNVSFVVHDTKFLAALVEVLIKPVVDNLIRGSINCVFVSYLLLLLQVLLIDGFLSKLSVGVFHDVIESPLESKRLFIDSWSIVEITLFLFFVFLGPLHLFNCSMGLISGHCGLDISKLHNFL